MVKQVDEPESGGNSGFVDKVKAQKNKAGVVIVVILVVIMIASL